MAETTLEKAKRKLALWEAAEDAIAAGQEYQIGQQHLVKADLPQVHKMVLYFENEVARLTAGRGRGVRVMRIVPRDL